MFDEKNRVKKSRDTVPLKKKNLKDINDAKVAHAK
jgi:hypothetical protein